jgi:hypothetical protein
MTILEAIGYFAAGLGIVMLAMPTMIPLRITGIAHNVASIIFGLLSGIYPMVVQHSVLLPLNAYRLFEMLKLIRAVDAASGGDLSINWLKPFMDKRAARAGEVLFRKGDKADRMYYLLTGSFRLEEMGLDVMPGSVMGELGMLAPDGQRTQTLVCVQDGSVLEISYERIEEIYYQNPVFGFYFLRLSTARLFENIKRLESTLADRDDEIKRLNAVPPGTNSRQSGQAL